MACLDNVQFRQTVTYDSLPNTTEGYISGEIEIEILNIGSSSVDGTVTVDKVRDTTGDLLDSPIEQVDIINSSGETFSYKFYYPSNEPESITINVAIDVRIDDCLYSSECNHALLAPNLTEESSSCTVDVQGFDVISGCTDPLYYEYNPNANVDDGSCVNLIPVLGCTNPLATNYNPDATKNDGSCVFPSGCTNPIANNYNPDAVIDDGSCECGDINLQLDFFDFSGESYVLSGDCDYFVEFDLITKIDCAKFVSYFENDTRTVLDILNELKINFQVNTLADGNGNFVEYSGGTLMISGTPDYLLTQSENIFEFNIDDNPIGLGLVDSSGSCETFFDLLATNLGLECQTFDKTKFDVSWKSYKVGINRDLLNTFSKFSLNFENFRFGICTYIDNLKISRVCNDSFERCVLIPSKFGFEFDKVVDNKKVWVYSEVNERRVFDQISSRETDYVDFDSRLIFNTKELELRINPAKYTYKDVEEYYDYYSRFYEGIDVRLTDISLDNIKNNYINVTSRQTSRAYSFLPTIYQRYLDELDCAQSKGINYDYGFDVIDRVGTFWYKLVKNLVPATAIWDGTQYVLKNNVFHQQKHRYKKYSLTNGSSEDGNCATSGVTIDCQITSDRCFDTPYESIDDLLVEGSSDIVCTKTGDTVCFTDFIGDGSFTGKLVQYTESSGDTIEVIQLIGFDDYDCVTGDTTDICSGVNIETNLSYECVQISGVNTGFATLSISPSGGTPPYTISGGFSGQTVQDEDIINITVTDANGCQSDANDGILIIDCPSGETTGDTCIPVSCEGNTNTFSLDISIENTTTFVGVPSYTVNVDLDTTSGYSGNVTGSYKVSGLSVPEILSGFERYHLNADYTPNVELSNYIEFGFNQLTPVSPSTTDSPWSWLIFEDANIPDWSVGTDITFTVALYDDDYCVHKGTGTITLPADTVTNNITINF